MGKTKKQHYVPRLYLREFAIPNTERIHVYDLNTKTQRINNIMDVAEENRFYEYDIGEIIDNIRVDEFEGISQEDIEIVRDAFDNLEGKIGSTVEPAFAEILDNIISKADSLTPWLFNNTFFINEENKAKLSVCLAFQLTRTKKVRDFIKDTNQKITDFAKELYPDADTDHLRLSDKEIKRVHIETLIENDSFYEMAGFFSNYIWLLGVNRTDKLFYTSDAPIVMIPHVKDYSRGVGLSTRGVEVILPITPRLILMMFDGDYHIDYISKDRHYISLENNANIEFYNWYMMNYAHRFVFSSDGDFEMS